MTQNNQQPENSEEQEAQPLSVVILGFEAIDEESFSRFFQVTRPYQRKYNVSVTPDKSGCHILIVNYDNPTALIERDTILATYPHIRVVAVSRGPLNDPPAHHIRGMLFAARVLTTLDKVELIPATSLKASPDDTDLTKSQPTAETPKDTVVDQLPPVAVATPEQKVSDITKPETVSTQPQASASTLSPQVENKPLPQVLSPETIASVAADGYRCLVVDDSVAIQKSLEINLVTLPQIGKIDFADSGESALEQAEAVQYDLIFLDVMMPGIDGYETCTRLRKKPEYKKTPIIMVSGKTSPLDEVKGVMAGCTTYLTKPVQQEAFQKLSIRVLTWLEKQKKN